MFKDRTTATVAGVAGVAIVIMIIATLTAPSQGNPALVPTVGVGTQIAASQLTMTQSPNSSNPLDAGAAFLANNAKDPDVHTTPSGLQYKIVKQGTGPKPVETDTVTVNYKGTLIDGTVFDSSYDRGQPATFALTQVIPGWTEGLQYMPVGSTYMFYIPSGLGYGAQSMGDKLPANSTLIFQVDLLSIQGK